MGVSQSKRGEYKTQKNSLNPVFYQRQPQGSVVARSRHRLNGTLYLYMSGADKSSEHGTYQASEIHRGLIEPKKLPNPVKESRHHRDLHQELLFTHRRGMFPEHKPELQRVLEARRIRQLKKQEENEKPLTDLEEELRKRQEKLDQYERELVLQGEQDGRPEFILVKESLRKIKLSTETTEIKLSTEGIRQT